MLDENLPRQVPKTGCAQPRVKTDRVRITPVFSCIHRQTAKKLFSSARLMMALRESSACQVNIENSSLIRAEVGKEDSVAVSQHNRTGIRAVNLSTEVKRQAADGLG
jgi:hypothetical protein